MKARVNVMLKDGVLDPQGKAISGSLAAQMRPMMWPGITAAARAA